MCQFVEITHLRFVPIKIRGIPSSEIVDSARKCSCAGAVVERWSLVRVGGRLLEGVCRGVTRRKNCDSEQREVRVR